VNPAYYSAAWTECGCLITCSHHQPSVREAVACIRTAGGYVVSVHVGVMRSLTAEEEIESQDVAHGYTSNNPQAEDFAPTSSGAALDSRYVVMIRIRIKDRWTWRTWMCFESYKEAAAHARAGDRVVRFGSPEWLALRQQSEPAPPILSRKHDRACLNETRGKHSSNSRSGSCVREESVETVRVLRTWMTARRTECSALRIKKTPTRI
jgi:hypothetical protein